MFVILSIVIDFTSALFTAGSAAIAGSTHCVRASGNDTAAKTALLSNDFFIVPYLSYFILLELLIPLLFIKICLFIRYAFTIAVRYSKTSEIPVNVYSL